MKAERYREVSDRIDALIEGETDAIAVMSTVLQQIVTLSANSEMHG